MAIILHFKPKNETLEMFFFKWSTLPEPPPGGATPAGVVIVIVIVIPFFHSGFPSKKGIYLFFKHLNINVLGYIGRRRRIFFKLVVVFALKIE